MIFNDSKYTNWYFNIINKRIQNNCDGYSENHHIVPSSLGGTTIASNLVKLTAKEHYICHLLLTKMVNGNAIYKMKNAVLCMSNLRNRKHLGRKIKSGRAFQAAKTGLVFSKEHLSKLSAARKTRVISEETKRRTSETFKRNNSHIGWNLSVHSRNKQIAASKRALSGIPKERVTCPHCNTTGGKPAMMRFHFSKCKEFSCE